MPDLPEPSPRVVTDHMAHRCVCPHCQGTTQASFPEGVKAAVQYGPHLTRLAVYLSTYQLIPTKRLIETVRDLFGVRVCTYPKGPLSTGSHGAPTPTRALPGPCSMRSHRHQ